MCHHLHGLCRVGEAKDTHRRRVVAGAGGGRNGDSCWGWGREEWGLPAGTSLWGHSCFRTGERRPLHNVKLPKATERWLLLCSVNFISITKGKLRGRMGQVFTKGLLSVTFPDGWGAPPGVGPVLCVAGRLRSSSQARPRPPGSASLLAPSCFTTSWPGAWPSCCVWREWSCSTTRPCPGKRGLPAP